MKLLIVEDQRYPLEALEFAVDKVVPTHFPDFAPGSSDVVKCYNDAQRKVSDQEYDVVLLDNRMPYEDQGDLERRDMRKFSASLRNMGYSLISVIKDRNPDTVVIGTSSLSKDELKGMPAPDFTMSKMWGEAEAELEAILEQVKEDIE